MDESETQAQRQKYQAQADATGREVWWRGEKFVPAGGVVEPSAPKGARLYKVITQRDEFFGGQFDPAKLETLVNKLAAEGWRVVGVATADVSTFWGSLWAGRQARQEMVVFMERAAD